MVSKFDAGTEHWWRYLASGASGDFTEEHCDLAGDALAEIDRLRALHMDALQEAWGLIANAFGGDWSQGSEEWRVAAAKWRDERWRKALTERTKRAADLERVAKEEA